MTISDLLPWLNLLLLPMGYHVLQTERRIAKLEARMGIMLASMGLSNEASE